MAIKALQKKVIQMIDKHYADNQLDRKSGWINIKDKLPDDEQIVLIVVNGRYIYYEIAVAIKGADDTINFYLFHEPRAISKVLAWQPIEPYKDGE